MNHTIAILIEIVMKWGSIILCASAAVLGCVAIFGALINLFKSISGNDSFRIYYIAKTLLAAAVAYGYYFLYNYRGFNESFMMRDTPKSIVIMAVCLFAPIAILQAAPYLFLMGSAKKSQPKKK